MHLVSKQDLRGGGATTVDFLQKAGGEAPQEDVNGVIAIGLVQGWQQDSFPHSFWVWGPKIYWIRFWVLVFTRGCLMEVQNKSF